MGPVTHAAPYSPPGGLPRGSLVTSCRQRWSGAPAKTGHQSGKTHWSHLFLATPTPHPPDAGPEWPPSDFPTKVRRVRSRARSMATRRGMEPGSSVGLRRELQQAPGSPKHPSRAGPVQRPGPPVHGAEHRAEPGDICPRFQKARGWPWPR